jgi:DNA polymerase IV (DinB-like DNA polymerase)
MTDLGSSELPTSPDGDGGKDVVLHVDMDCFYVACERLRNPSLEEEPVVIGMGYEEGTTEGVVATASYEARDYGVDSAVPIAHALEDLPPDVGHILPVDMSYYKSVSEEVSEILFDEADTVRVVSVDEAYLDVTDKINWDNVEAFARRIKDRIKEEVGIIASVGVAPNMSAAKIASDHDKPDGLLIVRASELRDFLAPLDIEEVHEVGPETARELRQDGVETAGDLAETDPELLEDQYGKRGRKIYRYARGEDNREVSPADPPKSFLRDSAFSEPIEEPEQKCRQVRILAQGVAERAHSKDAMYQTVGIKVVTPPFDISRRSKSLSGPGDDPDLVERVALELLQEFMDDPVRKLGVTVRNLTYSDQQQASLSGWDESSELNETWTTKDQSEGTDDPINAGQSSLTDFS